MAQISIPMANKVGYSMYWHSMWDSKINFSRVLKEDIYLNRFIPMMFEDEISNKILKTIDFNTITESDWYNKYCVQVRLDDLNKTDFCKYLNELNKIVSYNSKVWIFKYQKWVIIYFFMYFPKYNSFRTKNTNLNSYGRKFYNTNVNVNDAFGLYKSITLKLNYSYDFFKNNNYGKDYF